MFTNEHQLSTGEQPEIPLKTQTPLKQVIGHFGNGLAILLARKKIDICIAKTEKPVRTEDTFTDFFTAVTEKYGNLV